MENYITAREAAELAGVTKETIYNLCKAGALTYKLRHKAYEVKLDEVVKYKDTIQEVHSITRDIKDYKQELASSRQKISEALAEQRLRLIDINMFPRRIQAITQAIIAVFKRGGKELNEREFELVMRILQGEHITDIAEEWGLTRERVAQIWIKALGVYSRKEDLLVAQAKQQAEITRMYQSQIDELNETIAQKNGAISGLMVRLDNLRKGLPEEPALIMPNELNRNAAILNMEARKMGLSVRALNVLKALDITRVHQLISIGRKRILYSRNCGKKSIDELTEWLESNGLSWDMDLTRYEPYLIKD